MKIVIPNKRATPKKALCIKFFVFRKKSTAFQQKILAVDFESLHHLPSLARWKIRLFRQGLVSVFQMKLEIIRHQWSYLSGGQRSWWTPPLPKCGQTT